MATIVERSVLVTDPQQLLDQHARKPKANAAVLGKLADLLERSGISIEEVGRVQKVSVHQGFYKDKEGVAHKVDMAGITFSPSWETGPEWPVMQAAPRVKMPARSIKPIKALTRFKTAVVIPDIQAGYFRAMDGTLVSTHDEAAIEVALAVIRAEDPDLIVLVGDNADLPEFGKYRLTPAFEHTTQHTIDRLGLLVGQLRDAAPRARIVWIAGNHEERLPNYILDNAKAAYGLRRANTPASWPVLSIPDLCHFDEHKVEYLPGYPSSHFWINEKLKVIHGDRVASGGSTAHKYLANQKVSVIYGHVHRREWAERTRHDHDGAKTTMAASPGCLAKTDGAVPSTKGGVDLDGRPLTTIEDWQQGVAVVRYEEGDGMFAYEQIAIFDGWALHRGEEFRAVA